MPIREYLLPLYNFWPVFFFSGIKIIKKSKDFRYAKVRLKLRFWTANFVGTQYGGSMFSMTDAFYMVMLIKNLGPGYSIWDKAATIRYLKPGKTDVFAEFNLSQQDLDEIKKTVEANGKMEWIRKVEILNTEGELIAEVERTLSIKKKVIPAYTC